MDAIETAEAILTSLKKMICGEGIEQAGMFFENRAYVWECACGAPTYQQPCPFCNYYPDAGRPACGTEPSRKMTREDFLKVNFALVFVRSYRNTVAYAMDPAFADRVHKAEEVAKSITMDNGALWDACYAATTAKMNERLNEYRRNYAFWRNKARIEKHADEREYAKRYMLRYEKDGKALRAAVDAR